MITLPRESTGRAVDSFWDEFKAQVKSKPKVLKLDCSNLDQVTSSHIKMIWQARAECLDAKVEFELVSPTEGMKRVLKVLDLYSIYFPDEPENELSDMISARREECPDDYLKLECRLDADGINEALDKFRSFIADDGIPQGDSFELATVFYEVATNIRLHSEIKEQELISVEIALQGGRCIMQFTDNGRAFDPTSHPAALEPKNAIQVKQIRGYGLAMVAKMTDRMLYTRKAGKYNVLVLEKSWG